MTIRTDEFALTPTLYAPVAQYALRGHGVELYADRSGNARDLSTQITPAYAPDGYNNTCLHAGRVVSAALVPLQITGDLTLTVRAWACAASAGRQFINNANDGTAVASPYCMLIGADGRLACAVESSTQQDYLYTSPLQVPWGRWALYSMRRDVAAGRWTLGINKTFATSPVMTVTVPLAGTQPKLFVGGPDVGGEVWRGASADKSIWNKRLTDAQVRGICDAVGIEP
jgi:concanavalin A-like lectin/glucanase superfamily protein